MADTLAPPPPLTPAQNRPAATIDYSVIQSRLKEFLQSFTQDETFTASANDHLDGDANGPATKIKYMQQIEEIFKRQRKSLVIDVDDLFKWGMTTSEDIDDDSRRGTNGLLHDDVIQNARRYQELLSQAADEIIEDMRQNNPSAQADAEAGGAVDSSMEIDNLNILIETRRQREIEFRRNQSLNENLLNNPNMPQGQNNPQQPQGASVSEPNGPRGDVRNLIPAAMTRTYQTFLIPRQNEKSMPLRYIRSEHVGRLVSVQGIVTRVTEVKPKVTVAVYVCHGCGYEVYQEITGRTYMPMTHCPTQNQCATNNNNVLMPNYTACKYVKYQEVKLQELSDQVPIGNIPRSLNIKLSGELTRTCTSGDIIKVSGIFLPVPFTGYKAMKAGFLADTFVDSTQVVQMKKQFNEEYLDESTRHELHMLKHDTDVYDKLSKSIAPEIYGHNDIKKALLLLLLGAPAKKLPDGMRLRGDLHICLMGDPGVAKSQFLKYISSLSPRGVYTTGKGSSGVGLTAAVMRDNVTNELILEGGALVLADLGIACIDEFDKMNEVDRTAIHEVMEQQTISIAKAGITTNLNARTSILAACNPSYGRYNKYKSPNENINLPAALLSRFDLLFLLLDVPKADLDLQLAKHVTHVHRTGKHPSLGFDVVAPKVVRAHIAEARRVNPIIDEDADDNLTDYLVDNYVEMRGAEVADGLKAKEYTSPRVLLSVLRLAQAICRLRLDSKVSKRDVDEALRLMKSSKASITENDDAWNRADPDADEDELDGIIGRRGSRRPGRRGRDDDDDDEAGAGDAVWKIYTIISEYLHKEGRTVVDIETAENLCEAEGFSKEDLMKTIEQYEDMDIWTYDNREHRLALV